MGQLTHNSVVEIRRGTTGAYTALGVAGLGNWGIARSRRNRRVPGLGLGQRSQVLATTDGSASFPVDDNETTAPLFWARSGEVFDVRLWPRGMDTGRPYVRMVGPTTITLTAAEGSVRRYTITVVASDEITEGTGS